MKGGLESGDKLAAEDTAEYFDGKEEGSARGDPAGVIRSETAGGQHAVDMGMMLQSLVPGMEHAEEADLRAEVPGIASDLQQRCSAGVKQQVVDQAGTRFEQQAGYPTRRTKRLRRCPASLPFPTSPTSTLARCCRAESWFDLLAAYDHRPVADRL